MVGRLSGHARIERGPRGEANPGPRGRQRRFFDCATRRPPKHVVTRRQIRTVPVRPKPAHCRVRTARSRVQRVVGREEMGLWGFLEGRALKGISAKPLRFSYRDAPTIQITTIQGCVRGPLTWKERAMQSEFWKNLFYCVIVLAVILLIFEISPLF